MSAASDAPKPARWRAGAQAAWVGVVPCPDADSGDTLCLSRQADELLAWSVTHQQLIGACASCGTPLRSATHGMEERWPGETAGTAAGSMGAKEVKLWSD